MKGNNLLTLTVIFMLLSHFVVGQIVVEKEIRGKISIDSSFVEGINVLNSSNGKTTVSDKTGIFMIVAKEGDVLMFSAINLNSFRKKINKQDLVSDVVVVKMTLKSIALKEVIIKEYPQISAADLGIISHNQKKYSPAERKLFTARSGILNAALNSISGRTEMLKKELIVEKKEQLLAKIDVLFEDKYYIKTLKIPFDYIKGFQYYCIEDMNFAAALKSKNKTMSMFLIVPLAEKYNQIIKNEK